MWPTTNEKLKWCLTLSECTCLVSFMSPLTRVLLSTSPVCVLLSFAGSCLCLEESMRWVFVFCFQLIWLLLLPFDDANKSESYSLFSFLTWTVLGLLFLIQMSLLYNSLISMFCCIVETKELITRSALFHLKVSFSDKWRNLLKLKLNRSQHKLKGVGTWAKN